MSNPVHSSSSQTDMDYDMDLHRKKSVLSSSNQVHITYHACKDFPASPDKDRIVEAFGDRKCPKLVEQLKHDKVEVQVNALKALCSTILKNPLDIVNILRAGLIDTLVPMSTSSTSPVLVRQGASEALAKLSNDCNGRTALVTSPTFLKEIEPLLHDSDVGVRINLYKLLVGCCFLSTGMEKIIECNYVPTLWTKITSEVISVQAWIFHVLSKITIRKRGLEDSMKNNGVEISLEVIKAPDADDHVKEYACKCLTVLSFHYPAKEIAISLDAVSILSSMVGQGADWPVKSAVVGALMSIMSHDEAKKQIFPTGGVFKLMRMIDDDHEEVVLPVLKVLACASVGPESRNAMCQDVRFLTKLDGLVKNGSGEISKHALITKKTVTWQP